MKISTAGRAYGATALAMLVAGAVEIVGLASILGDDASPLKRLGVVAVGLAVSTANYSLQSAAGRRAGYTEYAGPKSQTAAAGLFQRLLKKPLFKALNKDVQRINQLPSQIAEDKKELNTSRENLQKIREDHKNKLRDLGNLMDGFLRKPSENFDSWPAADRALFQSLGEQYRQNRISLRALEAAEERHREEQP